MWELDCEESWVPKNWCFWTVVLEKTLEGPLDCKKTQPVHLKGNQSCIFIGRTDAEAETPVLWPPHEKSWLIGKDSDVGRDWGQEEKGMTEDEMAGWHHWLDGRECEWTPGVGDGQGGLAGCVSWGHKESATTERLIWSDLICLRALKIHVHAKNYIWMFIAVLFITAKTWSQWKCTLLDKKRSKMWYIHTLKYYSTIRCNEVLIYATVWVEIKEHFAVWKKSITKDHVLYASYICNVQNKQIQRESK